MGSRGVREVQHRSRPKVNARRLRTAAKNLGCSTSGKPETIGRGLGPLSLHRRSCCRFTMPTELPLSAPKTCLHAQSSCRDAAQVDSSGELRINEPRALSPLRVRFDTDLHYRMALWLFHATVRIDLDQPMRLSHFASGFTCSALSTSFR